MGNTFVVEQKSESVTNVGIGNGKGNNCGRSLQKEDENSLSFKLPFDYSPTGKTVIVPVCCLLAEELRDPTVPEADFSAVNRPNRKQPIINQGDEERYQNGKAQEQACLGGRHVKQTQEQPRDEANSETAGEEPKRSRKTRQLRLRSHQVRAVARPFFWLIPTQNRLGI